MNTDTQVKPCVLSGFPHRGEEHASPFAIPNIPSSSSSPSSQSESVLGRSDSDESLSLCAGKGKTLCLLASSPVAMQLCKCHRGAPSLSPVCARALTLLGYQWVPWSEVVVGREFTSFLYLTLSPSQPPDAAPSRYSAAAHKDSADGRCRALPQLRYGNLPG